MALKYEPILLLLFRHGILKHLWVRNEQRPLLEMTTTVVAVREVKERKAKRGRRERKERRRRNKL